MVGHETKWTPRAPKKPRSPRSHSGIADALVLNSAVRHAACGRLLGGFAVMLQRISLTTGDDYPEEDSQVRTPALLAKRSSPSNDNGSRPASHSTLRVAVPPPPNA